MPKVLDHIQNTIHISDHGRDPILSRGETATLTKKNRNTSPTPKPSNFADICHWDIVYGNGRAIGGIYYALHIVCRKIRAAFIYPLTNLKKATIISALKLFILHISKWPKEMIADRDYKLIGQHVEDFFSPHSLVTGAPSGRQNQNGPSQINWRYTANIAQNWLAENFLPSEFWFFAIAQATQVRNYMVIKTTTNEYTTPYFQAYNRKPD